jgi:ribosome modulation factor
MSSYPQEYLEAAFDHGYNAYWEGTDHPYSTMPPEEKEYWYLGWNKAHMEGTDK